MFYNSKNSLSQHTSKLKLLHVFILEREARKNEFSAKLEAIQLSNENEEEVRP